MRNYLNCNMLPMNEDRPNSFMCSTGEVANVSSNVYYGYQRCITTISDEETRPQDRRACEMDIQQAVPGNFEQMEISQLDKIRNRKRAWEYSNDVCEFKKKRQNEPLPFSEPSANPYSVPRKPTHNLPDIPRCLLGHYV